MKSKAVLTGLLILLVFTSFSFKCNGGPPADNHPLRPAAQAAGDIAEGIKAMTKIKRALAKSGALKPAEERPLNDALLKLVAADRAFVKEIKALKSASDLNANKSKLCVLFAGLTSALSDVNSGLLPIGDANAKGQLATALATIMNLLPAITTGLACA
ncbi:MAG: hypothetical protein H7Z16_03835 [Pyrinomonadaceae bacterium]|nr:hypothetical protein [Pyrinomonadaceae bacterium]